jgi:uncharacterized SAM-binding protein YcdF (DUF218 family)
MSMLKSLATPTLWITALLVLGLVFSRLKRRKICAKAGWWLVLAGAMMLLTFSLMPVANMLTYSLERRYTPPSQNVLESLDIVVVLGGDFYPQGGLRREAELSGPSYSRVYTGVRAFRLGGASLLALCGGPSEQPEADVMKAMAVYMDVPEEQILTERRSDNTMENAACLAELIGTGHGRQIGLVTSATHMLRAERAFKKHFPDDIIVPVPTHYTHAAVIRFPSGIIPSVKALHRSTVALHEWVGILWYSVRYA